MPDPREQALRVAERLNIGASADASLDVRATADTESYSFRYHPERASAYDVLHEIGHVLCGYSCCREHCEFEAHGAAKALALIYDVEVEWEVAESNMDGYAGRTLPEACGRQES